MASTKKLSKTDKDLLINAIRDNQSKYVFGKVFASSLEEKRKYNSALKLRDLGLVSGNCEYRRMNGQQSSHFGRLWVSGFSWNEFSGQLTDAGLSLARELKTNAN